MQRIEIGENIVNTERDKRDWRRDSTRGSADYLGHHRYRHEAMFRDPDAARDAFAPVPFLNGGLFECLDVPVEDDDERAGLDVRPLEPVGPSNPGVLVAPSALADALEPWLA